MKVNENMNTTLNSVLESPPFPFAFCTFNANLILKARPFWASEGKSYAFRLLTKILCVTCNLQLQESRAESWVKKAVSQSP